LHAPCLVPAGQFQPEAAMVMPTHYWLAGPYIQHGLSG
jgi:hypothetical protein